MKKTRLSTLDATVRGRAREEAGAMDTPDVALRFGARAVAWVIFTRPLLRKRKRRRNAPSGGVRVWMTHGMQRTGHPWKVLTPLFPPEWRISVTSIRVRTCRRRTNRITRLKLARRSAWSKFGVFAPLETGSLSKAVVETWGILDGTRDVKARLVAKGYQGPI